MSFFYKFFGFFIILYFSGCSLSTEVKNISQNSNFRDIVFDQEVTETSVEYNALKLNDPSISRTFEFNLPETWKPSGRMFPLSSRFSMEVASFKLKKRPDNLYDLCMSSGEWGQASYIAAISPTSSTTATIVLASAMLFVDGKYQFIPDITGTVKLDNEGLYIDGSLVALRQREKYTVEFPNNLTLAQEKQYFEDTLLSSDWRIEGANLGTISFEGGYNFARPRRISMVIETLSYARSLKLYMYGERGDYNHLEFTITPQSINKAEAKTYLNGAWRTAELEISKDGILLFNGTEISILGLNVR